MDLDDLINYIEQPNQNASKKGKPKKQKGKKDQ